MQHIEKLKDEYARANGFANWNAVWHHFRQYEAFAEFENKMMESIQATVKSDPPSSCFICGGNSFTTDPIYHCTNCGCFHDKNKMPL